MAYTLPLSTSDILGKFLGDSATHGPFFVFYFPVFLENNSYIRTLRTSWGIVGDPSQYH